MARLERLRTSATDAAGQAFGALLRADERLVNGASPAVDAPLDPTIPEWAATIAENWKVIREELDHMLDEGVRLPETDDLVGVDQGAEGRWTTYVMTWYGRWVEQNCLRCPRTTLLLRAIPHAQVAGFTVLGPHTRIPVHRGPTKSYRWQMGVRIPDPPGSCGLRIGDDTVVWSDGATLAFDDRSPHEAWNDSSEERYVLFIQVPWPIGGWRGAVHRGIQRLFGTVVRTIPTRAAALDDQLNPAT
jgi:beta-hydroxylase